MAAFVILAEDKTDAAAVHAVIRRRLKNPKVRTHADHGCTRLRRKAEAWLHLAADDHYDRAIIVHDLDQDPRNQERNDEVLLRRELEAIECPTAISRLICIPVEELEAWFWSDPAVLADIGGRPVHASPSPHNIRSPKEKLRHLSRGANRKPRYSTKDNVRLAEILNLELCASRCPSMRQLLDFIAS